MIVGCLGGRFSEGAITTTADRCPCIAVRPRNLGSLLQRNFRELYGLGPLQPASRQGLCHRDWQGT